MIFLITAAHNILRKYMKTQCTNKVRGTQISGKCMLYVSGGNRVLETISFNHCSRNCHCSDWG